MNRCLTVFETNNSLIAYLNKNNSFPICIFAHINALVYIGL